MNVVLVYNPKSGNAPSASELRKKFSEHAITIDETIAIEDGFKKKLQPFVAKGSDIAVVGGDGTISAVAGLLVKSRATLIPLSGGTLNHFTKDLGIPQNLDEALAALKVAKLRTIDTAAVNDTVFINNSSIGLYPSSLRERDRLEDKLGKWPAAIIASIRTLVRLPGYDVTIEGETFRTPFVFIGNNIYEMDEIGTPVRKSVNKGVMSVFVAKNTSRSALAKIAGLSLIGKAHLADDFEIRTVRNLLIATSRHHPSVSHDGEITRMTSPLRYAVEPKSLRVLY